MKRYNNYHKHTHISSLYAGIDSNVHAEEYIKKSIEYGHTNFFTTEHGTMGDIFEAKTLCDKYGLKCIPGLEGYIVPDPSQKDNSNYHICIIPRTNKARKLVNYINSNAHVNGFYYRPRINPKDLLALNPNDVFITTACVQGLLHDETSVENILLPLIHHFGDNVFLEVQNHDFDLQKEINKRAVAFADEIGLKLIAANDSHYVTVDQRQERVNLINGKRKTKTFEDDLILDFPDYDTMFERFLKQGVLTEQQIESAMDNTLILDACEAIDINKEIKMPSIDKDLTPRQRYEKLHNMVYEKFEKIREAEHIEGEELRKYLEGIAYEDKIIEETNDVIHTADYFLFNTKNVDLAVNKYGGVLTRTGRGSCGSFYINRILGMTQLDRFKINLPIFPDRFASKARLLENRSLPDIDFNIKEQEPFVKASRELLGEHGCYPMVAYGTMQLSEAFRNVCRSHNLDFDKFNDVAKDIDKYLEDKEWKPYIEEAQKYVGTIVSASVHPCAHLLLDEDIRYELGVVRVGDAICTMITSGEADEYKYLKNDYLIVKVWKLIDETFKMIGKPIIPLNKLLEDIKDDERIWDLFKNGITCTLNQVDSDNGCEQAKRYGIHSFEDGALIAAAIRPSFNSWREKFLNHDFYTTGSKDLDKVLESTKHYILFQENLMEYFDWLGVTPAESIGLIKKISKKKIKPEDFKQLEERIKKQWIINTGSEKMFDETWEMIQSCMAYGFASPHACATSGDMCYGAYLKVNYPLEYYTVAMNNYTLDAERTRKLTKELDYFGINLSGVKFRKSRSEYTCDKTTNTIYKGLHSLKYMNTVVPEELYDLRNNQYDSFIDLLYDIDSKTTCNSRQLDSLIKLDFFSEFGDINDLLKQCKLFDAFGDKKYVQKTKLKEFGIPEDLVREIAEKETPTRFTVNIMDFLRMTTKYFQTLPCSLKDKIKYQIELLGYADYTDPDADPRCAFIMNVDTKYTPWIDAYCLKNGVVRRFKIHKSKNPKKPEIKMTWRMMPLEVGDIIYIKKFKKEHAVKKVDGEWKPIPDKFDYWINDYKTVMN